MAGDETAIMQIYCNDPNGRMRVVNATANTYEPNSLSLSMGEVSDNLDVVANIELDNYSDITAIQADFTYPSESYTVNSSDFHLSARCSNHNISATRKSSNRHGMSQYEKDRIRRANKRFIEEERQQNREIKKALYDLLWGSNKSL